MFAWVVLINGLVDRLIVLLMRTTRLRIRWCCLVFWFCVGDYGCGLLLWLWVLVYSVCLLMNVGVFSCYCVCCLLCVLFVLGITCCFGGWVCFLVRVGCLCWLLVVINSVVVVKMFACL